MAAALAVGCGGEPETGDGGLADAATMDGGADAQVLPGCERNLDCDNGNYCDGNETCVPGDDAADERGCVAGESPCADGEVCDEDADACENPDCVDGDGDNEVPTECGGLDCDDDDPRRYGGNAEVCDTAGFDEDCDDTTYNGTRDGDADGDGYVDFRCFNAREDGTGDNFGPDCDDTRADVSPEGTESCNGRDDDCDGVIDEGVKTSYYRDADGDGYGDPSMVAMDCSPPSGHVLSDTDCNDGLMGVNPGASEVCDGGSDPLVSDENCNGSIDEGCGCPVLGAEEPCGSPEALAGTGVCRAGTRTCTSVPGGAEWSTCVDAVNPISETGRCNGDDDDCDGMVDEGVKTTFYADTDHDGFGDPAAPTLACSLPDGYVANNTDCNDDEAPTVNPAAPEVCEGSNDENCNGVIDENCGCPMLGVVELCGSPEALAGTGVCEAGTRTCRPAAPVGTEWGPCVGAINPTSETCDGDDDDCDGTVDEGVKTTFYADADSDGFGDPDATELACSPPAGHVANDDDCDDGDDDVSPGDLERDHPCDGVNNDCDMRIDEGTGSNAPTSAPRWYRDDDDDGYGRASSEGSVIQCTNPSTGSISYVTNNDDCVDVGYRAELIHPGASFQSQGHCDGADPCVYNGEPSCVGCSGGMFPVCLCGMKQIQFDYDCDALEEPLPQATCSGGGVGGCSGARGPTTTQPSSACGTSVQHRSCCGTFECSWCSVSNQPLACR